MKNGTEAKYYGKELPPCDFPHYSATEPIAVTAAYDGKTTDGPWAYMCPEHFQSHDVGLGTGKGQKLVLVSDG